MMLFEKINGFPGKVYVPEPPQHHHRKHPCPDCFSCQRCSDDRCQVCRNKTNATQTQACTCKTITPEKDPDHEPAAI